MTLTYLISFIFVKQLFACLDASRFGGKMGNFYSPYVNHNLIYISDKLLSVCSQVLRQ